MKMYFDKYLCDTFYLRSPTSFLSPGPRAIAMYFLLLRKPRSSEQLNTILNTNRDSHFDKMSSFVTITGTEQQICFL